MAYTANKLARLSGVSVRTLHYYDAIGLLKPAYYGENHYRYYEEEQLLVLQQILFYKALGFALKDIQSILCRPDFDKIKALTAHKKKLKENLDQTKQLIITIDKTIAHLKGEKEMKKEELYYGFDSEKQKQFEKELVQKGIVSETFMTECKAIRENWTEDDKAQFLKDGEEINEAFVDAIEQQLNPSDAEVQAIVERHYAWIARHWTPTKESYLGLGELYQTPEFKRFYDAHHPELLGFLVEAMRVYAGRRLA